MNWELGRDAHESKGASPTSAHPVPGPAGSSGPWLDREEPWDGPQSPLTVAKEGTCLGFPVRSQAPCASGRLLAGGLPSRPQKQAMVLWAQNCQAPEVKAQMPCQPVPGENIWGLGNGP